MLNWVHVWTPSWPVHDLNMLLVQKDCRVTCCMGRGFVLDVHKVTSKHPCRPWQHLIPQDLDVPMPVHGSIHHDQLTPPHGGLHPIPWLTGPDFHHLAGRRHQSASPLAYGTPGPDRHCGVGRTGTHHWRYSVSIVWGPTLCASSPHSRRRHMCSKVSTEHLAGRRDQYPAARSRLRMVRTGTRLPNRRIICIRRRGAKMKRFVLTIRSSWRSSRGVEIFIESPRFLWCGRPVSRLRGKILFMHPWDTPSILATSCRELPSAHNLTICCGICLGKFCVPFRSSKKYQ